MTKKQLIKSIIEPIVWTSLSKVYTINKEDPTEKQTELVALISNDIVTLMEKRFTVKDLIEQAKLLNRF